MKKFKLFDWLRGKKKELEKKPEETTGREAEIVKKHIPRRLRRKARRSQRRHNRIKDYYDKFIRAPRKKRKREKYLKRWRRKHGIKN